MEKIIILNNQASLKERLDRIYRINHDYASGCYHKPPIQSPAHHIGYALTGTYNYNMKSMIIFVQCGLFFTRNITKI